MEAEKFETYFSIHNYSGFSNFIGGFYLYNIESLCRLKRFMKINMILDAKVGGN